MNDADTRRQYLLAVVRHSGTTVTTRQALEIYAVSPWRTIGRNAARRDLRDLARRAYLVPHDTETGRVYRLSSDPNPVHPVRHVRQSLLEVIRGEGGEWTVGRLKRAWHQATGTHVLRMSCRRYLAALHRDGHLHRHGDGTARRYYTLTTTGKDGAE
jgi:hypothetical protein